MISTLADIEQAILDFFDVKDSYDIEAGNTLIISYSRYGPIGTSTPFEIITKGRWGLWMNRAGGKKQLDLWLDPTVRAVYHFGVGITDGAIMFEAEPIQEFQSVVVDSTF